MEISQLCKSTVHTIVTCSNPYPYSCRDMPGQYIIGQIKGRVRN